MANKELIELDEIDADAEEKTTFTPKDLEGELGIDAKRIRAYLRKNHSRAVEAFRTSWTLDADLAQAVRDHFTEEPESDEDDGDPEE